jgi:hypothetical protein
MFSSGGNVWTRSMNEHNSRLMEADNSYTLCRTRLYFVFANVASDAFISWNCEVGGVRIAAHLKGVVRNAKVTSAVVAGNVIVAAGKRQADISW